MMMMMKSLLCALVCCQAVVAFQSTATAPTPAAARSSLLHQHPASLGRVAPFSVNQVTTTTTTTTALFQVATTLPASAETATLTRQGEDPFHPWDRVCATVSETTSHLNGLRQKMAKSGVATALSYSLVSNVFTSVAVSLAWYGFSMQVRLLLLS